MTKEHELNAFKSVQVSRVLHDFYDADPKRGFFGGGGIDARFDFSPIGFALGGLPPDGPQWGADYKRMLRESFTRTMQLLAHSTTLPLDGNSISLDPDVKDFWGLPAMRVTFKNHPDDVKTMQFLLDRQMEILDAAGAQRKWAYPVTDTSPGAEHLLDRGQYCPQPPTPNPDARFEAEKIIVTGDRGRGRPRFQAHLVLETTSHFRLIVHWKRTLVSGSSCIGQFSSLRRCPCPCILLLNVT